ncbi:NUC173-domain-containing protein [Ramicandelaber brevisporus]|nr:NUC173-domain-containing protein [Ramicandelaber brevisporus]
MDTLTLEEQLQRLRQNANSKLENHKAVNTTLAAVEEVLAEKDPSAKSHPPAAYFGVLLSLLSEGGSSSSSVSNSAGIANNALYLLALVLPYVSEATRRSQFAAVIATLVQYVASDSGIQQLDAAAARSVCGCIEALLVALEEQQLTLINTSPNSSMASSARRAIQALLALSADPRPKVRRRAQDALATILNNPPAPLDDHPLNGTAAEFCLRALRACSGDADAKRLLHVLATIKAIAQVWPAEHNPAMLDLLLQLPKRNNAFVTAEVFKICQEIFSVAVTASSSTDEDIAALFGELSALRPDPNDVSLSVPWLTIVSRAYPALAKSRPGYCLSQLPAAIQSALLFVELGKPEAVIAATNCIEKLLTNCITTEMAKEAATAKSNKNTAKSSISRIIQLLGDALGMRYKDAWGSILGLIGVLFRCLGRYASPIADDLIVMLGNLRTDDDFELPAETDAALGAAVFALGPERFLQLLPLNLGDNQQQQQQQSAKGKRQDATGRAWLLPVLKEYTCAADLSYFVTNLGPLALEVEAKAKRVEAAGRGVEAKVFETVSQQIWALLPGFCSVPSDVAVTMNDSFGELLSNLMFREPEVRPTVCAALGHLVTALRAIADGKIVQEEVVYNNGVAGIPRGATPITVQVAQAGLHQMSIMAPNFLVILFNIFSQTAAHFRGYMLEVIRALLTIAPSDKVAGTFTALHTQLVQACARGISADAKAMHESKIDSDMPAPPTHTMIDLCSTMIPYVSAKCCDDLMRSALLIINEPADPVLQKKAYRVIERLITTAADNTAAPGGVTLAQLFADSKLLEALRTATESTTASARKERLACLVALIKALPNDQLAAIPMFLAEAIVSTKEASEKAREAAYELVVEMGHRMALGGNISLSALGSNTDENDDSDDDMDTSGEGTRQGSLTELLVMVSAALAGETPHMQSATILVISRLVFEFRDQLLAEPDTVELVDGLISTILEYIASNNREIARACLGFTKVISVSLPTEHLEPHLKALVTGVLKWSNEHKNKLKLKARHVIERLVRRFDADRILQLVPPEHAKLVQNIKKSKLRAKRAKDAAAEQKRAGADGSDAEASDSEQADSSSRRARAAAAAGTSELLTEGNVNQAQKRSMASAYEEALYGSESEMDSDDEDNEDAGKQQKSKAQQQQKKGARAIAKPAQQWLRDDAVNDADGPLDFLDRSAMSRITSAAPSARSKAASKRGHLADKFKTDSTGKLIINDNEGSDDNQQQQPTVVSRKAGDNGMDIDSDGDGEGDAYRESVTSADAYTRTSSGKIKFSNKAGAANAGGRKKRTSDVFDQDFDNELSTLASNIASATTLSGKQQQQQSGGKPKQQQKKKSVLDIGKDFRSKKSHSDIKRSDGVDPYAYVPLSSALIKQKGKLGIKEANKSNAKRHKTK